MSRPQAVQPPEVRASQGTEAAPAAASGGAVPIPMHLSELKAHHVTQLVEMAVANGIENASRMRKQDLIFAMLKSQAKKGVSIFGDGTLEVLPDGFGFLRSPETSYLASTDDIYVSPSQIRRFNRTPATRSKARSARRRTASATSRWSRSTRSTAKRPRRRRTRSCSRT